MPQLMQLDERECTNRCKSRQHAALICAALTKRQVNDAELCSYLQQVCCCCGSVKDDIGRTALHLAASCGRSKVVKWLIRSKHSNINSRDEESGYTPLHRSIFYGWINIAVHLIKLGANTSLMDFNGLTCLEHAMYDSAFTGLRDVQQGEVYVWGSNTNYTLGLQQERSVPELLDAYHRRRPHLAIKQVCLEKFHCILVDFDGRVSACGHGQGGRLGLPTEKTVLQPQHVKLGAAICKRASIAVDHSVFLTDSGNVWTCGLNTHRVLGVHPNPPDRVLTPTALALFQHAIGDVCATKYHTIAWGPTALYAWGLHGGQLGHDKTAEKYVVAPKLVTCVFGVGAQLVAVAASNGATAVVTSRGDIYVLHEYRCRKIASRQLNIAALSVVGGKLNEAPDGSSTGEELVVIALKNLGNVYVWKESDPQLARCIFSVGRPLRVRQVALNLNEMLFVTQQGEAFRGTLRAKKRRASESAIRKNALDEFLDKDACHVVKVNKIPHVHRALSIHSDLEGRNYAVLQADPKKCIGKQPEVSHSVMEEQMKGLWEEARENDSIQDVTFKIKHTTFHAHHYVIASGSKILHELINASISNKTIIEIENVEASIFGELLCFLYTGSCDLLKAGRCPEKFIEDGVNDPEVRGDAGKRNKLDARDPIRMLDEVAKRFGVKALRKLLAKVCYHEGFILVDCEDASLTCKPKFDRRDFSRLYDVRLRSREGKEIGAHKCVLAARLDYFNNLFSARWSAADSSKQNQASLTLPFSHRVLAELIEFLYTDELPALEDQDLEHICNLLVLSDQLFVLRLKEICECALSRNFVTLKNVVQTLSFSSLYNAVQLKAYCMEFISVNLAAILESRCLERINDESLLKEVADFYCERNAVMRSRIITPYSYAPSDDEVASSVSACGVSLEEEDSAEERTATAQKTQKKRSRLRRSTLPNRKGEETVETNEREVDEEVASRLGAVMIAEERVKGEEGLRLADDFPELNSCWRSPGKRHERSEARIKVAKVSQKQRKRLSSSESQQQDEASPVLSESPRNPWKMPTAIPNSSSPIGSPDGSITMDAIIGDERRQKENLVKMRTKLLIHTQVRRMMEDKAIEDLRKFYNVDLVFDEVVSVGRVQIGTVASPVWVHLNKTR